MLSLKISLRLKNCMLILVDLNLEDGRKALDFFDKNTTEKFQPFCICILNASQLQSRVSYNPLIYYLYCSMMKEVGQMQM